MIEDAVKEKLFTPKVPPIQTALNVIKSCTSRHRCDQKSRSKTQPAGPEVDDAVKATVSQPTPAEQEQAQPASSTSRPTCGRQTRNRTKSKT
jgi:hypothetical protein